MTVLPAERVTALADAWLWVTRWCGYSPSTVKRTRSAGVTAPTSLPAPGEAIYTTVTMRQLECDIVATFEAGQNQRAAFVAPDILDAAITASPSIGP